MSTFFKFLTGPSKEAVVKETPSTQVGLLVTKELEEAIANCRAQVQRISKQCRAKNSRFRDLEFDVESDQYFCLYGLFPGTGTLEPSDVQRVTQIFDTPVFFKEGGAKSSDVAQGKLGDCWFLSALATVATFPGLIENVCVERDESIGVYGFIFFKDNAWTSVIIDDMLYTSIPKWEELKGDEQALYHFDKDVYNKTARKHGKGLYFASAGDSGESWVPLMEKAYAKLHGNFSYLEGGFECEAVEDLTGGVSTIFESKDIWDVDRFWDEELILANKDRIFGCAFGELNTARSGAYNVQVQGLYGGHAYSVLRAVECNGKRFVVCRNPWGKSEWTGRWSDGSKEWTHEWLMRLSELGHKFGDDGQFVMEYSDWLHTFSQIDRTFIFDSSWCMSSEFLKVPVATAPSPWSFGDVSFTFTLSAPSKTIIVLSELDKRYFKDLAGSLSWNLSFVLVKEGETEPMAESAASGFAYRGINIDIELDAGKYFVYVRLDRWFLTNENESYVERPKIRQLARILTQRAKSQSIVSNFDSKKYKEYLPVELRDLIERDLNPEPEVIKPANKKSGVDESVSNAIATDTPAAGTTETKPTSEKSDTTDEEDDEEEEKKDVEVQADETGVDMEDKQESEGLKPASKLSEEEGSTEKGPDGVEPTKKADEKDSQSTASGSGVAEEPKEKEDDQESTSSEGSQDNDDDPNTYVPRNGPNTVWLGLRVYTHKDVPAEVKGRLAPRKS